MARYAATSCDWDQKWAPDTQLCAEGSGLDGLGTVRELRFHTVTAKDKVERYIAVVLDVAKVLHRAPDEQLRAACSVSKDKYGVEEGLDHKGADQRMLSADDIAARSTIPDCLLSKSLRAKLHPTVPGRNEFWSIATSDARHFQIEDEIRFRTAGDSFFLKSFYHTKQGAFGSSKNGQVMAQMSSVSDALAQDKPMFQDEQEGCESDEWSD